MQCQSTKGLSIIACMIYYCSSIKYFMCCSPGELFNITEVHVRVEQHDRVEGLVRNSSGRCTPEYYRSMACCSTCTCTCTYTITARELQFTPVCSRGRHHGVSGKKHWKWPLVGHFENYRTRHVAPIECRSTLYVYQHIGEVFLA